MRVIVQGPETHPRFTYREMVEGARFENPEASETIGLDLVVSFSITYKGVRGSGGAGQT